LLPGIAPQAQAQPGAAIIYVPDDYPTIQEAVNASSPGDTIVVGDGSYTENIAVTRDHLTIKSQNGAGSTIVAAANSSACVFAVNADYVSITGFTVTGAAGEFQAGIYLRESRYCNISNNIALNSYDGISLAYSYNNTLTNNTAKWNTFDGILVALSGNNTLTGNTANENDYLGIRLYFSPPNTLRNNSMNNNLCNFYSWSWSLSELKQDVDTSNIVDGKPVYLLLDRSDEVIDPSTNAGYLAIINSTRMTVKDLTINHSGHGVLFAYTNNSRIENVTVYYGKQPFLLFNSSHNTLKNITSCYGVKDGVRIWFSNDNTLTNCTSNSNLYGVTLFNSTDNILTHSYVVANYFGIFSQSSEDNVIYLNAVVNNTINVFSEGSSNIWKSPERLVYTCNGSNYTGYLGNCWSDYRDNCPRAKEIDSTGVWDTPYTSNGIEDRYPLVRMVDGVVGVAPPGLRELWPLVVAVTIIAVSVYFLWGRERLKGKNQKSK